MAKIIAIANQKGGVGKSTTAVNIADAYRHFGKKVLFIDMDPQHNSTSTYGAEIKGVNTIVDVMKKDCTAKEAVQTTPLGDIIAGDEVLAQEESYFNSRHARELILKGVLKTVEDEYDYIIIDTPPNLGIYMVNALSCCSGVVIPIKAEQYAIDGLGMLLQTVNEIHDVINNDLRIYGVVLDMFDKRNALDNAMLSSLPEAGKKFGFSVFKTPIRVSQEVKKVQSIPDVYEDGEKTVSNRSLFENYRQSKAAFDYVELVKELTEVIYG